MVKSLTTEPPERPTPLGTLLSTAGRRLSADLDVALADAGFADLRAAHTPLFLAIAPEGSTSTELAARTHMTKQSMGELVRHLEKCGYVEVAVGAMDRRARVVQLTGRGQEALRAGLGVVDEFDAWLADAIGDDQVRQLRATLQRIIAAEWNPAVSGRG